MRTVKHVTKFGKTAIGYQGVSGVTRKLTKRELRIQANLMK